MPIATNVDYIGIHCSAGFGDIPSLLFFWRVDLGWKNPGYHIIVDLEGVRWYVTKKGEYSKSISEWYPQIICNGIKGYNNNTIHICYIGGVEKVGNKYVAKDTRTDAQKAGLIFAIIDVFNWLKDEGMDLKNKYIPILGHRDFSPDKNGNGVIEPWERIKECPSFDAIKTYEWITVRKDFEKTPLPKPKK